MDSPQATQNGGVDIAWPPPLDLSHHFSQASRNRHQSEVKDFYKFFRIPGIAQLAGGLPAASLFPFDTLEAAVALPERFKPSPNHPSLNTDRSSRVGLESESGSSRILVPHSSKEKDPFQKIDLTTALQYGTAQGYPPLFTILRQFTRENLHPVVPYAGGPDIILTCGNTDGFAKTIQLLSNEWYEGRDLVQDREGLLVEEFAYMNAIQAAAPRGLQIVPVSMDGEGMTVDGPNGLRNVLAGWDEKRGKRPHLMYTVSIGQNPTSGTLSIKRRKDLYKVCSQYDVIIIEDEPYWYLQYPSAAAAEEARGEGLSGAASETVHGQKSSGFEFLDSLLPSYVSIDTDGRVIRLDTFSKTVAPGCRLGWITAQPAFCERLLRITETSTQQPSGFVQSMVAELFTGSSKSSLTRGTAKDDKGWAVSGWVRWIAGLRGHYERNMQTMASILDDGRYLVNAGLKTTDGDSEPADSTSEWSHVEKLEMYTFVWPRGGMFLWVSLNLRSHPVYGQVSDKDLSHALWIHLTTRPFLVLVAPGTLFCPTAELAAAKGPHFFRLCFAAISQDEIKAASHRFVAGMRSFWAIKDLDEVALITKTAAGEGCSPM